MMPWPLQAEELARYAAKLRGPRRDRPAKPSWLADQSAGELPQGDGNVPASMVENFCDQFFMGGFQSYQDAELVILAAKTDI